MTATLSAEWLKLRTLRGAVISVVMVGVVVAAMALLAWYAGQQWDAADPEHRARAAISPLEAVTAQLAQMCLAILGILVATTEYRDGTLRLTLIASPRRAHVVAAKALAVGGVALIAGVLAVITTYLEVPPVLGDRTFTGLTDPSDPHTPWLLLGRSLIVPMTALAALGLGLWLRSTAGSITIVAVVLFVVPIVAQMVPDPLGAWIRSLVPDALPGQLAGVPNAGHGAFGDELSRPGAAAAMLAYPLLLLGAGLVGVLRRDA